MAIITNRNGSYGPPRVTDKYTPLLNVNFNLADQAIYTGMLNNRAAMLNAAGLLGLRLYLATTPSWATIVANEAGHLPPLVVVSSNRAGWIRRGIDAGDTQLNMLGIQAFANASDLRALTDFNHDGISPPLYAPSRIGANRNVYVVVYMFEYMFYKAQLAGTGITPVGWRFSKARGPQADKAMVGFGATRFAAMEFCKELRRRAAAAAGGVAPWNAAWIIDDNAVALDNFAGFVAAENALGINACAALHGGSQAETAAANRQWAINQLANGFGVQVNALPPSAPPGIPQQAVLWNVDYFDQNFLNFGPLFIASAEDTSIGKYFDHAGIPYQYYNGIGIRKEVPTDDNQAGAQLVNAARQLLTAWVTTAEGAAIAPVGGPPPPINIQPTNNADGGVQTLATFVTTRVLPNANQAIRAKANDPATQAQAKSHGVEQMTSGAIEQGFIGAAALNATFRVNGNAAYPVQTVDVP